MDFDISYGNIGGRMLGFMGKASYNIFLAQMLYYRYFSSYIYSMGLGLCMELGINIAICTVTGCAFYIMERLFVDKYIYLSDFGWVGAKMRNYGNVLNRMLTSKRAK